MQENTLGERIAALRKKRGITQEQFAQSMGVSAQAVSKWENDASCPDITTLPQIADYFHITIDTLLKGEQPQEPQQLPQAERRPLSELVLKVIVTQQNGKDIKVRVPMAVVKLALELGTSIPMQIGGIQGIENIDLQALLTAAENGTIGKIVDVDTDNGEHIEVIVT